MQIEGARNFPGPELLEMRSQPLRIEQGETTIAQSLHQGPKSDLGRPSDPIKHRLAKKRPSDRNPIKAADELVSRPRFDRMCPTEGVQVVITFDDLFVDP